MATVRICASPLVRAGIEQILETSRFVVTPEQSGEADTAPALFIIDERHYPDGVTERIAGLRAEQPGARIVVLADQFDMDAVRSARQAGADGFCLSSTGGDLLIHSLELVMLGEVAVPSSLILSIISDGVHETACPPAPTPGSPNGVAPQGRPLSSREIEILGWLREGASNKVIARELNMAEATVKVHVKAILRKIGAGNRTQAAIWAVDHLPHASVIH